MPKLQRNSKIRRQRFKKRLKSGDVALEERRELIGDQSKALSESREQRVQISQGIGRHLQPLPVGDLLAGFNGEAKVVGSRVSPGLQRLEGWHPVKRRIDLH